MKVDCPHVGKTCDLCGKAGHLRAKCQSAGKGFASFGKGFGKGKGGKGFGKGKGKESTICWDYEKGTCARGDSCCWSHGGEPTKGLSCFGCGSSSHKKFDCPSK